MPSIRPFKGLIYNKKKIKNFAKVVAPPYDVIPPKMQDDLYKRHKDNIVRLILGKIGKNDNEKNNRYTRAGKTFKSWLRNNILIKEETPAIYIYAEQYKFEGRLIERFGFIGLMKLDLEDARKTVLPHENTLKAPKMDRLNLMRAVHANLSPVFMLYEDEKHVISDMLKNSAKKQTPFIDVKIENVRHRVWKLTEPGPIRALEEIMAKKDVFIADGHHRYETARNYAIEVEKSDASSGLKNGSKYLMAYFCELDDDTLTILPTHRLIKDAIRPEKSEVLRRLERFFIVEKVPSAERLMLRLKGLRDYHAFGIYLGGKEFYVLRLKEEHMAEPFMGKSSRDWKNLDVSILHLFIIQNVLALRDEDDNIEFVKDFREAVNAVDKRKFKIAFFLNPTKVSQMKKVARHGERMPRKATYFYPKPLSGLVINKFA